MVLLLERPPAPPPTPIALPVRRPPVAVSTPTAPPVAPRSGSARLVNFLGGLGLLLSAVLLGVQLRHADLGAVWQHLRIEYLLAAAAVMALSLVAAAYNLLGFSPLRLRLAPTVGAQLAVSGLRVIAPSALSTPAIAGRYLRCSGASASDAVATVAVAQTAQLLVTTGLVAGLGLWSGAAVAGVAASRTIAIAVAVVGALAISGWLAARWSNRFRVALGAGRRSAASLWQHARNRPGMVAAGLAGAALLTATHVLAFALCLTAVGGQASLLSLTLIYLAAAGAGSLIPTPGGVGAVEAALIAGLTATGVALPVAAAASLLSRLISVWLLAIPGWIALAGMRRRGLL
jgi:glycosyltransferase 2 family protein